MQAESKSKLVCILPKRSLSKRRLVLRKVCKPRAEPNLFGFCRGEAYLSGGLSPQRCKANVEPNLLAGCVNSEEYQTNFRSEGTAMKGIGTCGPTSRKRKRARSGRAGPHILREGGLFQLDEHLARHLGRLFEPHEFEHRRSYVGQHAVVYGLHAVRYHDDGHRI